MTNSNQAKSEKLAALYERVQQDEAFRKLLKADPKSAVEPYMGKLPDGVELKVVQNTGDTKYLHVPSAPNQREVSDGDLLGAQGGTGGFCAITVLTLTVGLGTAVASLGITNQK
ncbi:hypothetical protein Q5Y75_09160 [Ruegeria sp. 2205SS24-7]|uniref:hypothetical protein n=1 Tax=Ruegeria discodermiae TaxID=3064389 RepID=UPI002741A0F5|nr:hypothetical protein [Ruegeria sp. 2205SS24-7]MDP5217382.1 hypothetical protein [Ruegeria sp. 2205SS24-7]